MKLLVNAPSGLQQIIEISTGGGYYDPARVIWDERADGPLPGITIGGMIRTDSGLEYSQARMDENNSARLPSRDEIISKIAALDLKRIRPIAEGDTEYLASLNAQILALRAKL